MPAGLPRCAAALSIVFALLTPHVATGDWPAGARALCTDPGPQRQPAMVSDGAGGAIVAWNDDRGVDYDIYAQHVLASGLVDPAWPVNGGALTNGLDHQEYPRLASDGAGGAIVTWEDNREQKIDIYAQHVLASGVVDPDWPANGRALCITPVSKFSPAIVADGSGGAIVAWNGGNIHAQHVLASGAVDPAWPECGRALSTAPAWQEIPAIISDGMGGAIVTWQDERNFTTPGTLAVAKDHDYDVYAQHVLASGALDPGWPADGLGVCIAPHEQWAPILVSDDAGGAIVTWTDRRSGTYALIYAQHVLPSGTVDPVWPVNGQALSNATYAQYTTAIVRDQSGGAIVGWAGNSDIHAQHVLHTGVVDQAWPADGQALCTAVGDQLELVMAADGAGGAIGAWTDYRSATTYDLYAQHVFASGALDNAWPADGLAVSTAPLFQELPTIAADEKGGAIVAWQDSRNGNYDIYAQHLVVSAAVGVPGRTAATELALARPSPNPARERVVLRVALPRDENVSLVVFDEVGRRVRTVADGLEARGERTFTWDLRDAAGRQVRSGLYFVELTGREGAIARKLVVAR